MAKYFIKHSAVKAADGTTKTGTIKWILPFFGAYNPNKISEFQTCKADYPDGADEDTKFLFRINFLGKKKSSIEIYFCPPDSCKLLKYSLKKKGGDELAMMELSWIDSTWKFMAEINNIKSSEYLEANGQLHLYFEFTIIESIKLNSSYETKALEQRLAKDELNNDLENLLDSSIYSDVTIKSAEGVEFQTHKGILAIRCAVLKAHFEHNTVESQTNIIDTPLETEVLKEVLRYIYTGNTPIIVERPEKLLAAADYYQLERLKHFCEEAVSQKLSVDNAIGALQLADLHSAKHLKKNTLDFIRDPRHAGLITKTKEWKELQSGALIKILFEYVNGQIEAVTVTDTVSQ